MRSVMKLAALIVIAVLFVSTPAAGVEDTAVWQEFATDLKNRALSVERIRPYEGLSAETILGWLKHSWRRSHTGAAIESARDASHPRSSSLSAGIAGSDVLPDLPCRAGYMVFQTHRKHIHPTRSDRPPADIEFSRHFGRTEVVDSRELYWSQQVYFYGLISAEKAKLPRWISIEMASGTPWLQKPGCRFAERVRRYPVCVLGAIESTPETGLCWRN